MFSLSSKVFYKNIFLTLAYCLFFVFINLRFIRIFGGVLSYNQTAFVFLSETLNMSLFSTVFFLFLSYEFFAKAKMTNLEECISATRWGRLKLMANQFIFIAILIIVIAVTTVIYNLVYPNTDIHNSEYILHMLGSVFFYLFIVPLSGAFIGICASLTLKRLAAYLWMIAFVLLSSPLAGMIAFTISDATMFTVNITPFFDIFNLYPPNYDFAPIYNFGISLLPYKFEAVFFWIFAAVSVVLLKISKKSQHVVRTVSLCCAAVCLLNLIAFFQPASKIDMSYRVDGTLFSDQFYYSSLYEDGYPEEQEAQFQVVNYDLNMAVKNQLHVAARVRVDKEDLSVYPFTLYHNFVIKKITDQNNTPLRFKQEADHVTVYPSGQTLSELTFVYSGYNTRFYSNTQGVFLPGYFAYYPVAGYRNIYSPDLQYYAKMLLINEADFHLTVNSNKQIFTNLEENSDGTFSGKTNGLTIMSGFLKSITLEGIEIVYPHFNTEEYNEEQMKKDLDAFMKVKKDDIVRKIFIVPGVNQKSDSIVAFSDYLTAEQLMALSDRYVFTKMLDFKQRLYLNQKLYLEDRASFNSSLEDEKSFPPEFDRICTLYQEAIDLLGEDVVVEKTNQYIFDNQDTRSVAEFLTQLGDTV